MDGGFPIMDDDLDGVVIPHGIMASVMMSASRNERRTDARGWNVIPVARLINALQKADDASGAREAIERAYYLRIGDGKATALSIGPGTIDVTADTGIEREANASIGMLQDATDDPTLARLLKHHGVERLPRIAKGLDGRWAMPPRSPHPYVAYAGLPAELPGFVLRGHTVLRMSVVEIHFPQGVVYTNQNGLLSISLVHPLPETIAINLGGVRVGEVIEHEAFENLVFHEDQRNNSGSVYRVRVSN